MDKIASKYAQSLVQLGLTKQEASIYTLLWQEGSLTAEQVGKKISSRPQVVYRAGKKLEDMGLITTIHVFPHTYQAIPPSIAFPKLIKEKTTTLSQTANLLMQQMSKHVATSQTSMNLIMGQEESYIYAAKMLDQTKKEMLVISIGEEISEDLLLSVKHAHERGMTIRMIAQQYDEKNKEILEHFKKNGYEIRHAPSKGFHLAIYDGEQSLLIVDNEKHSVDRAAIHIKSIGLSHALRRYFLQLWETAIPV